MNRFIIISILAGIVACDGKVSDKEANVEKTDTQQINGQSPNDYFNQFLYTKTEKKDEKTGEKIRFYHYLTGSGFQDKVNLQDNLYATIEIALKDNGTFQYQYEEKEKDSSDPYLGTAYNGLFGKIGNGKWHVKDAELILEGLGKASGIMVSDSGISTGSESAEDEKPGIMLTFQKNIESDGLNGKTLILAMSNTWTSYESSPVDEWKNYNNR